MQSTHPVEMLEVFDEMDAWIGFLDRIVFEAHHISLHPSKHTVTPNSNNRLNTSPTLD